MDTTRAGRLEQLGYGLGVFADLVQAGRRCDALLQLSSVFVAMNGFAYDRQFERAFQAAAKLHGEKSPNVFGTVQTTLSFLECAVLAPGPISEQEAAKHVDSAWPRRRHDV